MKPQDIDKISMIENFLESIHYGNKKKADKNILRHLSAIFNIPKGKNLKEFLLNEVDFTDLFSELLNFVEPYSYMLNDIYTFLSSQKMTTNSASHILIGENAQDMITFDLKSFPEVSQTIIKKIQQVHTYDFQKVLDKELSPLPMSEVLLGSGYCNNPNYHKTEKCKDCDKQLKIRFEDIFKQYEKLIFLLPSDLRHNNYCSLLVDYYNTAKDNYLSGKTYSHDCLGSDYWDRTLLEIQERFSKIYIMELKPSIVTEFVKFFKLPFWNERYRLYEVWTLVHLLDLAHEFPIKLNIKNNCWDLSYNSSKEHIAVIKGTLNSINVWYQHKYSSNLRMITDAPVMPEIIFFLDKNSGNPKPIILIECKERLKLKRDEIYRLASYYRDQIRAELNIFCNYYQYDEKIGIKHSRDKPTIIICDEYRPGKDDITSEVDKEFISLLRVKIKNLRKTLYDYLE